MHDTTAPKLPAGTYTVRNGKTYTVQVWDVSAEGVSVYAVPVPGIYAAAFLCRLTRAEAGAVLASSSSAVLSFTPAPKPLGNPAAKLHRELGRLGFRDHYAAASEALGFPVRSLAELTAEQGRTVRSYARGQWGMSA